MKHLEETADAQQVSRVPTGPNPYEVHSSFYDVYNGGLQELNYLFTGYAKPGKLLVKRGASPMVSRPFSIHNWKTPTLPMKTQTPPTWI